MWWYFVRKSAHIEHDGTYRPSRNESCVLYEGRELLHQWKYFRFTSRDTSGWHSSLQKVRLWRSFHSRRVQPHIIFRVHAQQTQLNRSVTADSANTMEAMPTIADLARGDAMRAFTEGLDR